MPAAIAQHVAGLPPVSSLFAAVLGVNPVQHLLGPTGALTSLPAANQQALTGREFFPQLISGPFHQGLVIVFGVARRAVGDRGVRVAAARRALRRSRRPRRFVVGSGLTAPAC